MSKTIQLELPAELEAFIRDQVAGGTAASQGGVILTALECFRRMQSKHQDLGALVQQSIAEADRGEFQTLDSESTKAKARRLFNASDGH